ncbi:MAG: hypothetical protein ACRD11_11115 [Terriglobia bacterium]
MKAVRALTILAAALVLAGCPNRHAGARLIYTPAPPPAAKPSAPAQAGVMVIEQPAPPARAESAPAHQEALDTAPVQAPVSHHRPARAGTPENAGHEASDANAAAVTAPPATPPQLAPASSAQQKVELEHRIGELKRGIQERINRLSQRQLSSVDRKALQDARLFLSQADQAAGQGDLQQSLNLAQKADLLIAAVEKRY